jgi:phage-related protein
MAGLNYNITYNNISPENRYAQLATIPIIEPADYKEGDRYSIPARDGEMLILPKYRSKGNAHVKLTLQIKDKWLDYSGSRNLDDAFKTLQKWLTGNSSLKIYNNRSGIDSNTLAYNLEVIQITTNEIRKDNRYGRLEVDFEVFPMNFLASGDTTYNSTNNSLTLTNDGDGSYPIYQIKGSSSGTGTLTVGSKTMGYTLVNDEWLTIDTRRMIAYTGTTNRSQNINGDYKDLYLGNGSTTITVSSGHIFKVTPHWGYKL